MAVHELIKDIAEIISPDSTKINSTLIVEDKKESYPMQWWTSKKTIQRVLWELMRLADIKRQIQRP